jgi:hypothetical protein
MQKIIETLQVQWGKPESSLIAYVGLLLEKYSIQQEAYHDRDFKEYVVEELLDLHLIY